MTNIFEDLDGTCHICQCKTNYILRIKLAGKYLVVLPTCDKHVPTNIELVERDIVNEEIYEDEIYTIDIQKKLCEVIKMEE